MFRARKHAYFFSCEIRRMFRENEINSEERHFQMILWKRDPNEPIQIYKLKTVTFGTTLACYLSTRVLKQLAIHEENNFPIAVNIVQQDVYLNDILTGCFNLKELKMFQSKFLQLFASAGMSLHK
ncbi:DUF1758 domain-containing protein [Nephila pilipes]|uniref:DUF1758 domain-containing protein n=1 Tax=Nephila pilipes TaxID=299642 RepID=A0A8X6UA94_NEPPI|nr:DUF1758 domain-containing protein [Nephila pilipes]